MFGSSRTYYANVNRGKFRGLSQADEVLADLIQNPGRKYQEELSDTDIQLMNQKAEAGFYAYGVKGIYSSNTPGSGEEFTPTNLGGQLIDQVNLISSVRGNHQMFQASSDPYELPLNESEPTVTLVKHGDPQGSTLTPQNTQTGKLTFQHHKLIVASEVSTEFEEDSVGQSLGMIKQIMAKAIARAEEGNIYFDATLGMGQSALAYTAGAGEDKALSINAAIKKLFTSYQGNSEDLIAYVNVAKYRDLLEANGVQTVSDIGPKATMLTGEISRVFGVPISVSDQLANDFLVVYRPAVLLSQRRSLTVRSFPVADDKTRLEASVRVAIAFPYGLPTAGTETTADRNATVVEGTFG